MERIDKIDFHDKTLLGIEIKSEKDFLDNIFITIQDEECTIIIFCKDCISINFIGNAWIQGRDSIRELCVEKAVINETQAAQMPKAILDKIRKLYINLNTSNSVIEIIACEIGCFVNE